MWIEVEIVCVNIMWNNYIFYYVGGIMVIFNYYSFNIYFEYWNFIMIGWLIVYGSCI